MKRLQGIVVSLCLLWVECFQVQPRTLSTRQVRWSQSEKLWSSGDPMAEARLKYDSQMIEDEKATAKYMPPQGAANELEELKFGCQQVASLEAFDPNYIQRLATVEDFVGIAIQIPLLLVAFQTALSGEILPQAYAQCAAFTFVTSIAHTKMCLDEKRDWRAPRLGDPRCIYEFSALYLVPFSWLLYRMTPIYPKSLEIFDVSGCIFLSAVTIYGVAFAINGKGLLQKANNPNSGYQGRLQPSSPEFQNQAQLYLTGNAIINTLACLFLPFAWTLALRGTEWWNRVQELHPNEAAFLGVSVLVAILGDTSGNLLLRLKQLQITTSPQALVSMGILSNIFFLLVPEAIFNVIYSNGVSEIGFYWE